MGSVQHWAFIETVIEHIASDVQDCPTHFTENLSHSVSWAYWCDWEEVQILNSHGIQVIRITLRCFYLVAIVNITRM